MIHRQAKLNEEQLKNLGQLEVSIQHWSTEHARLLLQSRTMLDNIGGLYQAHRQIVEAAIREAGVDPATVKDTRIAPEGVIHLVCVEPAPLVPPQTSNGVEVPAPPPEATSASSS